MNCVRIKTGVMGMAAIARRSMIPAILRHPAFELTFLASRRPEAAAGFAVRTGDYRALLAAPEVELVYVPLPTGLHAEWIARALEAGKHVLSEKSLATTAGEAAALTALARSRNRLLMETFQFRFHSQHQFVHRLLAEKRLGEIRLFRSSFGFPPFADAGNIRYSRALGGGALLDAGAYTLKALDFILPGDWRVRAATERRPADREVDLGGAIMLDRPDGCAAQLAYGFDNFYQCSYELWGSAGRLTVCRAFTAPADLTPEVVLETRDGREVMHLPADDHFHNLLTRVAERIRRRDFDGEYRENLLQAERIAQTRKLLS